MVHLHLHKYLRPAGPEGVHNRSKSLSQMATPPLCQRNFAPTEQLLPSGNQSIFRKDRYFRFSLSPTMFTCIKIYPLQKNQKAKRASVIFFSLLVWSLALQLSKQNPKDLDIFVFSCFIDVEITPWRKIDSFQKNLKRIQNRL